MCLGLAAPGLKSKAQFHLRTLIARCHGPTERGSNSAGTRRMGAPLQVLCSPLGPVCQAGRRWTFRVVLLARR